MTKKRTSSIIVENELIEVVRVNGNDYLSLTSMVQNYGGDHTLYGWMRNRNTIEFLGIWEGLNNPNFKGTEFDTFKKQVGLNGFTMTPRKWINATNAVGITSKSGRGGGTYAHVDIAFEFGSYISAAFKLALIKEFQRLKANEGNQAIWDSRRYLSSVNYKLQTNAIKDNIIPTSTLPARKHGIIYANEADLINVVVFGMTSEAWRNQHPDEVKAGLNPRDTATAEQLVILANMESLNSMYIEQKKPQTERLQLLVAESQRQRTTLNKNMTLKQLELNVSRNDLTPYSSEKPLKIDNPKGGIDSIDKVIQSGD